MADIGETHSRILAALWAAEGVDWIEVRSEIHGDYKEIPFWILISPDVTPIDAHRRFWEILASEVTNLNGFRLSVSYKSIVEGKVLWHGFFDDLDGIRRALQPEGWGQPAVQELASANIFQTIKATSPVKPRRSKKNVKRR